MKTIILSVVLALSATLAIDAQESKSEKDNEPGVNKRYKQEIPDQFSQRIITQRELDSLIALMQQKKDGREQYPGSSRYYAEIPYLKKILSEDNAFVRKPDTSAKYYLIVKNPLNQKVYKY